MYNTENMGPKPEKWREPIHIKNQEKSYYNAYSCGYGAHEKTKKARHKAERKANKNMCR